MLYITRPADKRDSAFHYINRIEAFSFHYTIPNTRSITFPAEQDEWRCSDANRMHRWPSGPAAPNRAATSLNGRSFLFNNQPKNKHLAADFVTLCVRNSIDSQWHLICLSICLSGSFCEMKAMVLYFATQTHWITTSFWAACAQGPGQVHTICIFNYLTHARKSHWERQGGTREGTVTVGVWQKGKVRKWRELSVVGFDEVDVTSFKWSSDFSLIAAMHLTWPRKMVFVFEWGNAYWLKLCFYTSRLSKLLSIYKKIPCM